MQLELVVPLCAHPQFANGTQVEPSGLHFTMQSSLVWPPPNPHAKSQRVESGMQRVRDRNACRMFARLGRKTLVSAGEIRKRGPSGEAAKPALAGHVKPPPRWAPLLSWWQPAHDSAWARATMFAGVSVLPI